MDATADACGKGTSTGAKSTLNNCDPTASVCDEKSSTVGGGDNRACSSLLPNSITEEVSEVTVKSEKVREVVCVKVVVQI